ncbi:MAG: DinB family protein [Planctomycetota bacterium]|nr:DinB family protein [Planctomycetota bacterium]
MTNITQQSTLADAVLLSRMLLERYLAGFDDTNHTRQAPGLPNHAAWNLGHLALTMHRVAAMFDGAPMPEADLRAGDAHDRTPTHFWTESIAFGSAPTADAARYPAWIRCREIFAGACERLASVTRSASDEKLASLVPWGGTQVTLGALVARMTFHNGMHAGQIADLRRALGLKSIFA